jgi:hypothetical protein
MSAISSDGTLTVPPGGSGPRRLWDRQLYRYPDTGARGGYLAITVLATVVLYYQLYVQGAVATSRSPSSCWCS